jgi:3-phenylpropionate/cinnamic acid dioxygenase small subunit
MIQTEVSQAASLELLKEVEQFIYREARLQDSHQYDAWEALWTDDGMYWIPANGDDIDPESQMSIVYDNRSRIALRIKQFHTGKRHTQTPRSRLCRVVSNVEFLESKGNEYLVTANALIFEANARADTIWGARTEYLLRREGAALRMARKKVMLSNNDKPLYTLSFLV